MARAELLIAGLDEAGYGPRLGPMCLGCAAFRLSASGDAGPREGAIESAASDAGEPDLWRLLAPAVVKPGVRGGAGLVVGDSKRVKRPNRPGEIGGDAIAPLLRTVRAFLGAADAAAPATDDALLAQLGVSLAGAADWYAPQPAHGSADDGCASPMTGVDANRLRAALGGSGLALVGLRCDAIDERRFNAQLRARGSKAALALALVSARLRKIARALPPGGAAVVHVDRQSGRKRYADFLERAFPGGDVAILAEDAARSEYDIALPASQHRPARLRIIFEVDADERRFCPALASMVAKLVREILMQRFNAHWQRSLAHPIRPTAGYGADAKRFLRDIEPHISPDVRRDMVRNA